MSIDTLRLRIGNVANALRMIRTQAGRMDKNAMLLRIGAIETDLAEIEGDIYRDAMRPHPNGKHPKERILLC